MIRHIYVSKTTTSNQVLFEDTGYIPGTHTVRLFVKKSPVDETPFEDWTSFLTLNPDGTILLDVPDIDVGVQLVYDIELFDGTKKNYPYCGVVWA